MKDTTVYKKREGIAALTTPFFFPGECPLGEHPRPQFARKGVTVLNGHWDYAIRKADAALGKYDGKILVPFSPEFAASGVEHVLLPDEVLYYRRTLTLDHLPAHLFLHFDAVDD